MKIERATPNTGIGEVIPTTRTCHHCKTGPWEWPIPVKKLGGREHQCVPHEAGLGLCWTCKDKSFPDDRLPR